MSWVLVEHYEYGRMFVPKQFSTPTRIQKTQILHDIFSWFEWCLLMDIPVLSTRSNNYYNPHITEYHNKPHVQLLTVAYTILLLRASVTISSLLKPMYPNISGPSRTNQTTVLVAQPHPLATSHKK